MEDTRQFLLNEWKTTYDNYIQGLKLDDKIHVLSSVYSITDKPDYYASELGEKVVDHILNYIQDKYGGRQPKDVEGYKQELKGVMNRVIVNLKSLMHVAC